MSQITSTTHQYSPTYFISIDIRPSILKRSKHERYYIIKSGSSFYPNPEPILYLLGSFGNEYKLCFSKDSICCSCNNNNALIYYDLFYISNFDLKNI